MSGIEEGNRLPTVPKLQLAASATFQRALRQNVALFANNVTDERVLLSLDQERGTRALHSAHDPWPRGAPSRIDFDDRGQSRYCLAPFINRKWTGNEGSSAFAGPATDAVVPSGPGVPE